MITKSAARELTESDFIPGGERVDIRKLRFRRTEEHEVYRCCRQVADDIQSGPIYCGQVAEWVATTRGGMAIVATCERHAPPKETRD